jgi:autotransporter translocation and assembly factor TamB
LHAGGAGARAVALDVRGNKGDVRLSGQLDGVTVPGKQPDMLAAAPLRLDGEAWLAEPGRPVRFALHHPILDASGNAQLDTEQGSVQLTLPDLAPFAAAAGEQVQGRAAVRLTGARQQSGALAIDLNGTLGVTGGRAPVPALVGDGARIEAAASVQGGLVSLSRLAFNGQDLSLSAAGSLSSARLDLRFATTLPRLEPIDSRLQGGLRADGHVSGPTTDLALAMTLGGEVNAAGQSSGPFTARLTAQGLPSSPAGSLTAQGTLLGAPIDVALTGGRAADGALEARIERADWKSLAAAGRVALPAGATLPQGQLRLTIGKLADFTPLLGRPLSGGVSATLDATAATWRLDAQATDAGEPGTASIGKGILRLTLDHPSSAPVVDGQLSLDGVNRRLRPAWGERTDRRARADASRRPRQPRRGTGAGDREGDGGRLGANPRAVGFRRRLEGADAAASRAGHARLRARRANRGAAARDTEGGDRGERAHWADTRPDRSGARRSREPRRARLAKSRPEWDAERRRAAGGDGVRADRHDSGASQWPAAEHGASARAAGRRCDSGSGSRGGFGAH